MARGEAIERRPNETSEQYEVRKAAFLARVRARSAAAADEEPSDTPAAAPARSSGAAFGIVLALIAFMVMGALAFWRRLVGGVASLLSPDAAARTVSRSDTPPDSDSHLSFDERVKRRLAEMHQPEEPARPDPVYAPPPITPAVAGFGRKRA